jgi:hypothetical protein
LLNFSAINVNEFAALNWSTNNETNLDRIEVEKSTDNNQYNTATQKVPTGGIGTIATYNWTDPVSSTQPLSTASTSSILPDFPPYHRYDV